MAEPRHPSGRGEHERPPSRTSSPHTFPSRPPRTSSRSILPAHPPVTSSARALSAHPPGTSSPHFLCARPPRTPSCHVLLARSPRTSSRGILPAHPRSLPSPRSLRALAPRALSRHILPAHPPCRWPRVLAPSRLTGRVIPENWTPTTEAPRAETARPVPGGTGELVESGLPGVPPAGPQLLPSRRPRPIPGGFPAEQRATASDRRPTAYSLSHSSRPRHLPAASSPPDSRDLGDRGDPPRSPLRPEPGYLRAPTPSASVGQADCLGRVPELPVWS